jgi:hypothetical protein
MYPDLPRLNFSLRAFVVLVIALPLVVMEIMLSPDTERVLDSIEDLI